MPRYVLNKLIEAEKLNKRTGIAIAGLPTTIPYASFLNDVEFDSGKVKFTYMNERYQCDADRVMGFLEVSEGGGAYSEAAAQMAAPPPAPKIEAQQLGELQFSALTATGADGIALLRAKILGGWLVVSQGGSVAFVPDPRHAWSGGSLP